MLIIYYKVLRTFLYDMHRGAVASMDGASSLGTTSQTPTSSPGIRTGSSIPFHYLQAMKHGPADDRLQSIRETPISAVIDAQRPLCLVTTRKPMNLTVGKARAHTISSVILYRTGHARHIEK